MLLGADFSYADFISVRDDQSCFGREFEILFGTGKEVSRAFTLEIYREGYLSTDLFIQKYVQLHNRSFVDTMIFEAGLRKQTSTIERISCQ